MEYTVDQENAIKLVHKWQKLNIYVDIEDAFFSLYGPAGTGKTTVVLEILKILQGRICVAAPTHKAKDVIAAMVNKPGLTIHSLLGLRPNLDLKNYNPNNPQYATMAQEKIVDYDVIIIDECSMLNKSLTREIKKKAAQYKRRVIFVGDDRQLPPVGEALSTSFDVKHKAGLTEIVRQKGGNPNQELLMAARLDIDNNTNNVATMFKTSKKEVNINEEGSEQGFIITNNNNDFYEKLIELYSKPEAKDNMNFIKTIAYTNKAVETLNRYIKDRINPSEEILAEGDYLLGYDTVIDKSDNLVVQNSTDYYVRNLFYTETKISHVTFKFFNAVVNESGKTIRILHPDSYEAFHAKIQILYTNAIHNRAWRPYYTFLKNFVLMHDFYHTDMVDRYGNPDKIAKKSIDLGYAITVHKSQGSTYDNVAVIYKNFHKCLKANEKKQLAYVALSRTRLLNLIFI